MSDSTREPTDSVREALRAENKRLRELVREAYYEGALAGWHMSTPNNADIDPWWDESESRAALAPEAGVKP